VGKNCQFWVMQHLRGSQNMAVQRVLP